MTFLAPLALVIGGIAAAAIVALHLVSRHKPAAFVLPTTRFIPDQQTVVSRMAKRPRDLILLALRVLLLLAAATAFARPVLTPAKGAIGDIIVVDHSQTVADLNEMRVAVKSHLARNPAAVVIGLDSVAHMLPAPAAESLLISKSAGSISAALLVARREGGLLSRTVDSVRLTLISPFAASEIDPATRNIRDLWPGAIAVERLKLRADTTGTFALEKQLSAQDALGPAMINSVQRFPRKRVATIVRLVRGPFSNSDSTFARAGGTVVRWDTVTTRLTAAQGFTTQSSTIVAMVDRMTLAPDPNARVIARWADGAPAASERMTGAGCLRTVALGIPSAGDLPLRSSFQRIAREMLTPCGFPAAEVQADSSVIGWMSGGNHNLAQAGDLRAGDAETSPLVKWLLVVAVASGLAELAVRAFVRNPEPA